MAENTVHDMNPNTTNGLSAEMKTYYSDYLIDNAVPNLVHDQFGQKHPIPANGGKTINAFANQLCFSLFFGALK